MTLQTWSQVRPQVFLQKTSEKFLQSHLETETVKLCFSIPTVDLGIFVRGRLFMCIRALPNF